MQYLTMAMRNKWNESCYEKKRQQVDYINNYLLSAPTIMLGRKEDQASDGKAIL